MDFFQHLDYDTNVLLAFGIVIFGGAYNWYQNSSAHQQSDEETKQQNRLSPPMGLINMEPAILRTPSPISSGSLRKRKALSVDINYLGTENELKGCINDGNSMKKLWTTSNRGWKCDEICILSDVSAILPTRTNILYGIRWLVSNAKDGDVLMFHYSGHGSQLRTSGKSSPQVEDKDEALIPLDFKRTGFIIDDVLFRELVQPLYGKDVTLIAIIDACHSGTMLDLPFAGMVTDNRLITSSYNVTVPVTEDTLKPRILYLSGCLDEETSADLDNASGTGLPGGALTSMYLRTLSKFGERPTVSQLIIELHKVLRQTGLTQHPELSSNRPLDANSAWCPM